MQLSREEGTLTPYLYINTNNHKPPILPYFTLLFISLYVFVIIIIYFYTESKSDSMGFL